MKPALIHPRRPMATILIGVVIGILVGYALRQHLSREPEPMRVDVWLERGPTVWR